MGKGSVPVTFSGFQAILFCCCPEKEEKEKEFVLTIAFEAVELRIFRLFCGILLPLSMELLSLVLLLAGLADFLARSGVDGSDLPLKRF